MNGNGLDLVDFVPRTTTLFKGRYFQTRLFTRNMGSPDQRTHNQIDPITQDKSSEVPIGCASKKRELMPNHIIMLWFEIPSKIAKVCRQKHEDPEKKGRDLTQSYDKSYYTNINVELAK